MIGLIPVTAAGRQAAARLAASLGDCRVYAEEPVAASVRLAWDECEQLVCFLATGATVRLIAPLLADKRTDPGVVCVDEAGRFAVPLTGGHDGGANALAERIAAVLDAQPVLTTGTDAVGIPGLDTLGWHYEGDLAAVSRALLDGVPVRLVQDQQHPLPALPATVRPDAPADAPRIIVTDRTATGPTAPADAVSRTAEPTAPASGGLAAGTVAAAAPTVLLRPRSLVVGVGASRGASAEEVLGLIADALAEAGLSPHSLDHLATVDAKADEPGLVEAARVLGVRLVAHPAEALAAVDVPNPSDAPLAAVGTPSVAEAAALLGGGELLVPKRKSAPEGRAAMCTVAVVRRRPRGRLALVGLGPGARDLLTPRARTELRRASIIVGLDQYVDQIRDLLRPGTRIEETGLGAEEERARSAVRLAEQGHAVALIGSGDAGVYAMASPALAEAGADIDVVGVPGVTAALAASSLLGAPLGHDHVSISLSDLHTPWEVIERRVRAAAEADLVVTFYNPRSRGRDWQLPKALSLLAEHREPSTPVGVAHAISRPDEWHTVTTLAELDVTTVDMTTVVVVGNTASRAVAGRMVTPRGYRWQL
ncbi:precorrin-3B C(17)-methyltransferase [Streptacidiphilus sp. EB129]|uniref:precorrin-3B C(17)-methyltransferase n=1 Tax=Streptacidiphilus sp. EB129 TaxID=3156262 RepID=UPI003514BF9B